MGQSLGESGRERSSGGHAFGRDAQHGLAEAVDGMRGAFESVRLRVFTMLGQVLVFRLAQTLVLRRMEWTAIGERERSAIKAVVHQNADAILEGAKS